MLLTMTNSEKYNNHYDNLLFHACVSVQFHPAKIFYKLRSVKDEFRWCIIKFFQMFQFDSCSELKVKWLLNEMILLPWIHRQYNEGKSTEQDVAHRHWNTGHYSVIVPSIKLILQQWGWGHWKHIPPPILLDPKFPKVPLCILKFPLTKMSWGQPLNFFKTTNHLHAR